MPTEPQQRVAYKMQHGMPLDMGDIPYVNNPQERVQLKKRFGMPLDPSEM